MTVSIGVPDRSAAVFAVALTVAPLIACTSAFPAAAQQEPELPPNVVPHSAWEASPPLGYAADATRRNLRAGDRLEGVTRLQLDVGFEAGLAVVIIDADARSRERIADAVRKTGARVIVTASAAAALDDARALDVNVVLARADEEGLRALTGLGRTCPSAFRVAFGRKSAIDSALASGAAQAAADDPCSAKCLSELLQKRRARTPS